MKVYIQAVYGVNGFYIQARCESGVVVDFKSLTAWNKKAKDTVKLTLLEDYGYNDIKFIT